MNLIFDDNGLHKRLCPITLTRPVSEIRFGIDTITESWIKQLSAFVNVDQIYFNTEDYLQEKFPGTSDENALRIAGNIKANEELAKIVSELRPGQDLIVNGTWVASFGNKKTETIEVSIETFTFINEIWEIFQKLGEAIQSDFDNYCKIKPSIILSNTNQISCINNIYVDEGAKVEFAILNADKGPIYIGKDAEIMEGAIIRGPFAMGDASAVKMGAKIYGPTSIGQHCKVGGEISNSMFQAYSNKGHDGFLGNSVIGEWCNLGADTNSSNLKNNYGRVNVYSYETEQQEKTDNQFCGLLMGDHSKTGINTMLNTATVVGVSSNIFGGGFPDKFIPSFTWGGVEQNDRFRLDKAFEVAENMMQRRNLELSPEDKNILTHIFNSLA